MSLSLWKKGACKHEGACDRVHVRLQALGGFEWNDLCCTSTACCACCARCDRDQCFISKGYDATSHFETEINDVLDMYRRITGERIIGIQRLGESLRSLMQVRKMDD